MPSNHIAAWPAVTVDGNELSKTGRNWLIRAVIDKQMHLPDMFVLQFHAPKTDVAKRLNLEFGSEIVISATGYDGAKQKVLTAEVTAFEQVKDGSGAWVVVRGYDPSHRLSRGRRTRTFVDTTDADIVRQVADEAGVKVGEVDDSGPTYEHVAQVNLTDWEFLRARAHETGHEITTVDGRIVWRTRDDTDGAPDEEPDVLRRTNPLQLMLHRDLIRFRPRVTAAEQVGEVQVRGWDPATKEAVVGTAPPRTTSAAVGVTPAELADTFSAPPFVVVDRPVSSQPDADALAEAIADQVAGTHAEAEGVAIGNPHLVPGAAVQIGGVGWPHDGKYVLTSARHVYDENGYRTEFAMTGRQERSLLGLATMGATKGAHRGSGPPIYGLVIGQVTDADDPDQQYRVKVKFPWLSDDYESWWCRVATLGAGKDRGIVWLPEVGDEVLVGFLHGDTRAPFVVGSLFNGVDTPPTPSDWVDGGDGSIKQRALVSRTNHRLVLVDDDSKSSVLLTTGDDKLYMKLDKSGTEITIDSSGTIKIHGGGKVEIKSDADIAVEASGSLSLKGSTGVKIDGGPSVDVSGGTIKLN